MTGTLRPPPGVVEPGFATLTNRWPHATWSHVLTLPSFTPFVV
jgi:hypothetical protein